MSNATNTIDIYDPSVLESRPLSKDEVKNALGYATDNALQAAIDRGIIPNCVDTGGPNGQKRWFVWMFRKWNLMKAEQAVKKSWEDLKTRERKERAERQIENERLTREDR